MIRSTPAPIFSDYLRTQAHRSDAIGDLARTFNDGARARRHGRHYRRPENLRKALAALHATPYMLDALTEAAAYWDALVK